MNFYTDCDRILKIHYDYYLEGAFSEDNEAKSLKFDSFVKICKANLDTQKDGYFRAIQYTLTNDGYLKSMGELHDLLSKTHYVTPKGYTFVINGGYTKIVKDLQNKSTSEKITLISAVMGWLVVIFFGILQYKNSIDNNQKDISIIKLSNIVSSMATKKLNVAEKEPKKIMLNQTPLTYPIPKTKVIDKHPKNRKLYPKKIS